MTKLLSAYELAEYLNLKPVTIRRKAKTGEIPFIKIGNRLRFDKKQVDKWLLSNPQRNRLQIFVVDDEPTIGRLFEESLGKSDYQVTVSLSSLEALEILEKRRFDLIFLDLVMPEVNGVEFFRRLRKKDKYTPVAIITGYPDSDLLKRAMAYGPFVVMVKPFHRDDILNTIANFAHKNAN